MLNVPVARIRRNSGAVTYEIGSTQVARSGPTSGPLAAPGSDHETPACSQTARRPCASAACCSDVSGGGGWAAARAAGAGSASRVIAGGGDDAGGAANAADAAGG